MAFCTALHILILKETRDIHCGLCVTFSARSLINKSSQSRVGDGTSLKRDVDMHHSVGSPSCNGRVTLVRFHFHNEPDTNRTQFGKLKSNWYSLGQNFPALK